MKIQKIFKTCSKCMRVQPLNNFCHKRQGKYGLDYLCHYCYCIGDKQHRNEENLNYEPREFYKLRKGFKQCSKCEKPLLFNKFGKNKKNKNGLQSYCLLCEDILYEEKMRKKNPSYVRRKIIKIREGYKDCSKCKKSKKLNKFGSNEKTKDGLDYICHVCLSILYKVKLKEIEPKETKLKKLEPKKPKLKKLKLKKPKKIKPKKVKRKAVIKVKEGFKYCGNCKESKKLNEFSKRSKTKDGLNYCCRICQSIKTKELKKKRNPNYRPQVVIEVKEGFKYCSKCKEYKRLNKFGNNKRMKGGLHYRCRACVAIINIESQKKKNLKYKLKVKHKVKEVFKTCSICKEIKGINYFSKNKQNKDGLEGKCKACRRLYYTDNREQHNLNASKYYVKRRKKDLIFKLHQSIRTNVRVAFRGGVNTKNSPTIEYLSCTFAFLEYHLKRQFKKGMTVKNHGSVWHIDHQRPIASFDFNKNPNDIYACWHWTNLQPLFKEENIKKKDHYPFILDGK